MVIISNNSHIWTFFKNTGYIVQNIDEYGDKYTIIKEKDFDYKNFYDNVSYHVYKIYDYSLTKNETYKKYDRKDICKVVLEHLVGGINERMDKEFHICLNKCVDLIE